MKKIIKSFIPPILFDIRNSLYKKMNPDQTVDAILPAFENATDKKADTEIPMFEYIPDGWEYSESHQEVKGWNVTDILELHKQKWPAYMSRVQGTGPLCFSSESDLNGPADIFSHNTVMIFAYALALSAHGQNILSILDWGGAIGHYYLLAKELISDVTIDYHCKDMPIMAEYGKTLFPESHFYSDDSCYENKYDFVVASGALQYSEKWINDFEKLAESTRKYMLITRLPVVETSKSFVFIQRPISYGYNTAYLGWCINKQELIERANNLNLQLLREFIIGDNHSIENAPEQCKYNGFLFKKVE